MKAKEASQEDAALTIQAGFRGWQARKAVGLRRASDRMLKDLVAGRLTGLIVLMCGVGALVVGGLAFLRYYAEMI
jgi:TPP-dependent indolepyruvate ferredoxin oxidoreductase alpha subunit